MTALPPITLAVKIANIQDRLTPMMPAGKMKIDNVEVPYLSKNQVLNEIKPMMADEKLVCIFGGVDHVDTISRDGKLAGTYVKGDVFIQRYWVCYHLMDLDTGDTYSQIIPADVFGTYGRGATIALAFAARDFLIQIFLMHSNIDILDDDDGYSPRDVAKKLDMESLREVWERKAIRAVSKVTRHKVDEEAKKRGIVVPINLVGAPMHDLVDVMDICMELMYPSTEKGHLKTVGKKGE